MIPFESFSFPFFDLNFHGDFRGMVKSHYAVAYDEAPTRGLKGLYLHIPFCDTICNFCPFNKSVGSPDRQARYVDALRAELRTLSETPRVAAWELDSVYIGGGTPSVLTPDQLAVLVSDVKTLFTLAPNAEVSVEVEPKSTSDEKLSALRDSGANRISFGVQTFDPAIREYANLTATLDQVYETIALANKYFVDTNLDLMVGFPGHTPDGVALEMAEANRSGIGSVSVYPVDYVMTMPGWLEQIRVGTVPRPSPLSARAEMFHLAREVLGSHYTEQNMYCFGSETAPPTKYMFRTLYGRYADECIGVGAGAYSFVRGLASYNETVEARYVEDALSGELPTAAASPVHAYEKGLVFFPKRLTYELRDLEEVGLTEVYADRIQRVIDEGLVRRDGDTIHLTDTGKRMYSELMVYFFSDLQRRLYDRVCRRLAGDVGVIGDDEWTAGSQRVRSLGAVNAMTKAAVRHSRMPAAS